MSRRGVPTGVAVRLDVGVAVGWSSNGACRSVSWCSPWQSRRGMLLKMSWTAMGTAMATSRYDTKRSNNVVENLAKANLKIITSCCG